MPTTSPSIVTSGPPELPGLAAASNWIRLVSRRLPFGRAELALQPRDHAAPTPTGRCRTESRPRCTSSPGAQVAGASAASPPAGRRACCARLQHGEVVLGLRRRSSTASDSRAVGEDARRSRLAPATTCRLVRMMPLSTITTPVPTPPRSIARACRCGLSLPLAAPLSAPSAARRLRSDPGWPALDRADATARRAACVGACATDGSGESPPSSGASRRVARWLHGAAPWRSDARQPAGDRSTAREPAVGQQRRAAQRASAHGAARGVGRGRRG